MHNTSHRPSSWWTGLCKVLFLSFGYILLQMLLSPVRIRVMTSLLTTRQYGSLTLITLTISFLALLASLGGYEFLVRRVPGRERDYQYGVLKAVMLYSGSLVLVLAALGTLGLVWANPAWLGLRRPDVAACGAALVLTVYLLQRTFFLLGRAELLRFRITQFLTADTWFLPVVLLSLFTPLTLTMILWTWVFWLGVAVAISWKWVPLRAVWRIRPLPVTLREVLAFGLPLLPMLMGEWLFRLTDRYVLLFFRGRESVGLYTVAMSVAMVVYTVGMSVLGLMIPAFNRARNLNGGTSIEQLSSSAELRGQFSLMVRYSLLFSVVGLVGVVVLGRQVLNVISGPAFRVAVFILPWAAPVSLFFLLHTVFSRVLMALDRPRVVGGLTLAAAAMNAALALALVPRFGERGAALANVISLAALAAASGAAIRCWKWMNLRDVMPGRTLILLAVFAAGSRAVRHFLGAHSMVTLTVAGLLGVLLMLALGLVRRSDLTPLLGRAPAPDSLDSELESLEPPRG